jgi:hypothetical protein
MTRNIAQLIGLTCGLLLMQIVQAATLGPLVTDKPVQWHGKTIKPGDAETRVRRAVGRYPDSAQPLYLDDVHLRDAIGERWMFLGDKRDPTVLWIEFTHGRVTRVWTEATVDESMPPSQH